MAGLKAKLLKPASAAKPAGRPAASDPATSSDAAPAAKPKKTAFVDRAAARRQRDAGAAPPPSKPAISPFFAVPGASSIATAAACSASTAKPSPPVNPFATDSKGAQLLSKLGGGGGGTASSNGSTASGLGTLLEARTYAAEREARPGLGSRDLVVGVEKVAHGSNGAEGGVKRDWRDVGRERSYKRFREV